MLGSVHDADDALQDAYLRAWRAMGRFEGRSATGTWLHSDRHQHLPRPDRAPAQARAAPGLRPAGVRSRRGARRAPRPRRLDRALPRLASSASRTGPPRPRRGGRSARRSSWRSSPPSSTCPPRQRATLILRDVLGFSARETAEALDTTPASVNSALSAGPQDRRQRPPERSQQATARALGNGHMRDMVERFSEAFECGDVEAILACSPRTSPSRCPHTRPGTRAGTRSATRG